MTENLVATYRLQLNKSFTFNDAAQILAYIKDLHVSHVYLSPILESAPQSTHGYDVHDFQKISLERGGPDGFEKLHVALQALQLKSILDIVPNHMGIAGENPYWLDILARGPNSEYWSVFDLRVQDGGKLHLPVLDKSLADMIENNEIGYYTHPSRGLGVSVKKHFFPLNESTLTDILNEAKDNPLDEYIHRLPPEHLIQTLEKQHYKFVVWTESFDVISYRRFFDIMDLVGVRVEDEKTFNLSHAALFRLAERYPALAGVRVDHIDGLLRPAKYLETLRSSFGNIWVEKILAHREQLPENWPIQGTTGYEFIGALNELFIDPAGMAELDAYWRAMIEPRWPDFHSCVLDSKLEALKNLFSSELKRLLKFSNGQDEDRASLFWSAVTTCLPVYRTYRSESGFSDADHVWIETACREARKVFGVDFKMVEAEFLPQLLSPQSPGDIQGVEEWQQLSGPAMAKGLEDTAHYRYFPLAAMNEVGCEPRVKFSSTADVFAALNNRLQTHPHSLAASSTHDTKRSEDARCRLYALAAQPGSWLAFFEAVATLEKNPHPVRPATLYCLCQALIATWPFTHEIDENYVSRICAYMQKAAREARTETSWLKPDLQYEQTLGKFVKDLLANPGLTALIKKFIVPVQVSGALNSLSALTLKTLSGFVPDFYQGCDFWDFSLVDPDNRRPVDYAQHQAFAMECLSKAETLSTENFLRHLLNTWQSGAIKFWLTRSLLRIRKDFILPLDGDLQIQPLKLTGSDAEKIMAYTLGDQNQSLLVILPRYTSGSTDLQPNIHADLQLPLEFGRFTKLKNLLDGKTYLGSKSFRISYILKNFPIGVFQAMP